MVEHLQTQHRGFARGGRKSLVWRFRRAIHVVDATIRGIGPTLTTFGVSGVLADPSLQLLRGTTPVAANDNWGGEADLGVAADRVGAFRLPAASKDAVLLPTLSPGGYTATRPKLAVAPASRWSRSMMRARISGWWRSRHRSGNSA